MYRPSKNIRKLFYTIGQAVLFLILSCCDSLSNSGNAESKQVSRLIIVAQQKTATGQLELKFYSDTSFKLYENHASQPLASYKGTYKVMDTLIILKFDHEKPTSVGDTLFFVRYGLICRNRNIKLSFDSVTSSPFSYQTQFYFAEDFDISKLYGKWRREGSNPEIFHNYSKGYLIYTNAKSGPYDTTLVSFTSNSPPYMKQKFKCFFIIRTRKVGNSSYAQVMKLNDDLMELNHYDPDGCIPTHVYHEKYRRVK